MKRASTDEKRGSDTFGSKNTCSHVSPSKGSSGFYYRNVPDPSEVLLKRGEKERPRFNMFRG